MADELPGGSSVRIDGATPNGGTYSICYYRDVNGNPCPKSRSVGAEIVEFDAGDRQVYRSYTRVGGGP